jgi:hypothetical protein
MSKLTFKNKPNGADYSVSLMQLHVYYNSYCFFISIQMIIQIVTNLLVLIDNCV